MSLEREDGTRIGVLSVLAQAGGNTRGTFTVELRTEYKLDMDERVLIMYSPLTSGDERVFRAFTSIREMQESSDAITLIPG